LSERGKEKEAFSRNGKDGGKKRVDIKGEEKIDKEEGDPRGKNSPAMVPGEVTGLPREEERRRR